MILFCFTCVHVSFDADDDECAISNGGCDHVCVNSNGTYHCECLDGYTLGSDNLSCIGEL